MTYVLGIIEKDGKILFLLRQNTVFFSDHYGLVGGKIDEHESVADALIREVYEEVSVVIAKDDMRFVHCLSFKNEKGSDIVALIFKITVWQGEMVNQELDKCAEIAWFSLDNLPDNVIPRHRYALEMIGRCVLYSESGW